MKLLEVPISDESYATLLARAERDSKPVAALIEEALRDLEARRQSLRAMGEALTRLQEQAIANGTSEMTMDEIDAEIAEARREAAAIRRLA